MCRGQPGCDRPPAELERGAERGGGERVVDVVEPGQRERDLGSPAGVLSVKRAARTPCRRTSVAVTDGAGPGLAAAGAVVVAEMAEVDRVEDVRRAAAAAVLGVGGVRHPRQRQRVVLDAEVEDAPRSRPRSAIDGSSALSTSCASPFAQRLLPALSDRLELAEAVELIAKQVSEQDRARPQLRCERAEPQLIDLEQPELAVDRAPRAGGGEQRGGDAACHVRAALVVHELTPSRSRIAAASAAVVVLPLVAEISTLPWLRRVASVAIASGARRSSTLPGALVAPPPRRRESAPTPRASASLAVSVPAISAPWRSRRSAPAWRARRCGRWVSERGVGGRAGRREHRDRRGEGAYAHGQLADRVAVGVHRERSIAADGHLPGAEDVDARICTWSPLKTFGRMLVRNPDLADALDDRHVEQAVVEQRVRRGEHAPAVGLGVGGPHRIARERVALAGRVELDLKARGSPGGQRAQRAVGVDEPPEPRRCFVCDAVGVTVEAYGGDPYERVTSGVGVGG